MCGIQRLVWIGSVVPEDFYKKLCSMGYKNQQASRIAQLNIIQGLEHHYGSTFDYVSGPALPAYPSFPELKILTYSWSQENGSRGEYASYLNIEYINRLYKAGGMKKAAERLISRYSPTDKITVFVNSPHTPFIKAGLEIKKRFPNVKLVLIIPDLPQFMELSMPSVKRFLKSIDISMMIKLMMKFNYYVLYSSKMQSFLNLAKEKCVTMEGCVAADKEDYKKSSEEQPFTFMYSGTADKKYGLIMLVDAFMSISGECRLIITGKGNAAEYINEAAEKDKRIYYFGFIDDYSKVKQMQADADIMMNMRLPNEPASDYCFPSKLFEYMKTGNPVMSFKIGGIGEEYYDHLLIIKEDTVGALKNAMMESMLIPVEEREKLGREAKMFILEHKDVLHQTKLIYDLVEERE